MYLKKLFLLVVFLSFSFSQAEIKTGSFQILDAWNGANNPHNFVSVSETNFDRLPLSGEVSNKRSAWSETYWPSNTGGIASRWQMEDWDTRDQFGYAPPSKSSALSMKKEDIALLSPAEKYDLFLGNYDYPTVSRVRSETSPRDPEWYGICHGWAPASVNYSEPEAVEMKNPDGILIPFASSDVKALLSYYYAWESKSPTHQIGLRCNSRSRAWFPGPACSDTHAGAFHVAIANMLGLQHRGFVIEIDRYKEIWNQPVFGYESTVLGQSGPTGNSASGTVREIRIRTKFTYVDEVVPSLNLITLTPKNKLSVKIYEYTVELDGSNNIIGGDWITGDRPDFIWTKDKDETFTGYFDGLNKIYSPAK